MKIKWTYAKNLKDMPKKSGRYLLMSECGSFFVGIWNASTRKLRTQCMQFEYKECGKMPLCRKVKMATGKVKMAGWDLKIAGNVYWADIGKLDFFKIARSV